ncbi:RDD family protein [Bacillus aquiflavi]|uniref:RDD family protein n=1 Tax=Bacillus aquiflavi TaxID=2672567 RepID=UPI001CA83810|nr:RDD family protein [Bacillus aquiflavi]UAC49223.1 RDD family protein [Bacillus aquiflavi]
MDVSLEKQTNNISNYGGFWSRFGAYMIDSIILSIPIGMINLTIFIFSLDSTGILDEFFYYERYLTTAEQEIIFFAMWKGILFCAIISILITWLYYAVSHSSKWQATIGKKIVGLKVTDLNGDRISFWRATGRCFSKLFLSGFLLIGYMIAAMTDKKQALHDLIARTIVLQN